MVCGHLAHGAKGHDVIGEEGILAGDLAPGAQRIAVDDQQGGQGDARSGDESKDCLAVSAVARHEGKPEHGIGLDAGGNAEGHGRSRILPSREKRCSETDGDPHQSFDIAAQDNLQGAPTEEAGKEDGGAHIPSVAPESAHSPPEQSAGHGHPAKHGCQQHRHRIRSARLKQEEIDHHPEGGIVPGEQRSVEVIVVPHTRVFSDLIFARIGIFT